MAAAGHYALLARAPAGCPPPPITGSSGHVPHVSRAFGERLGTRPPRGAHRPPCPRGWLGSPRPPVPPSHAAACPLFVNVRSPLATGFFPVPLLASCLRWPSSPLDKEPGAPRRHGVPPEQRPQGVRPMCGPGTETRVPVARRRRRETRGRLQRLRLREGRGVGVPVPPPPLAAVLVRDSHRTSAQRRRLLCGGLATGWRPRSRGAMRLPPGAASPPSRKTAEAAAVGPPSPVSPRPPPALQLCGDRDPDPERFLYPSRGEGGAVSPLQLGQPLGLPWRAGCREGSVAAPRVGLRGFAQKAPLSWDQARGRRANEAGLVC